MIIAMKFGRKQLRFCSLESWHHSGPNRASRGDGGGHSDVAIHNPHSEGEVLEKRKHDDHNAHIKISLIEFGKDH